MTRQEYEAKLADLQSQIEELKQIEIEAELPTPPHPRPKLNDGEKYYYNEHDGLTFGYFWNDTDWDFGRFAIGNVFLTEKAAKFAAERLKVLAEMREWSGKPNDPYQLVIDYNISEFIVNRIDFPYLTNGEMSFATKDDAENCIKAVGADRIKKYYFMIPEDKA